MVTERLAAGLSQRAASGRRTFKSSAKAIETRRKCIAENLPKDVPKSMINQHNVSRGQLPSERRKRDALAAAAYKEGWAESIPPRPLAGRFANPYCRDRAAGSAFY